MDTNYLVWIYSDTLADLVSDRAIGSVFSLFLLTLLMSPDHPYQIGTDTREVAE